MFELTPFERRNHRHMAAYNPFREFEDFERNFFHNDFGLTEFKMDIKDEGNAFVLEADLPGFNKDDIHVDVDGNYLTISAERHNESEKKDKHGNYIRQERSYGSYSRSFDVSNVKTDDIKVAYKDGVLRLNLPKKDGTLPGSRRLEIE